MAVPLTNLWSAPDAVREVDLPMVLATPEPAVWLAGMGRGERLGLNGRLETQALMGEPVVVVSERPGWAEVELPLQQSRKGFRGYPGWVRRDHLVEPRFDITAVASVSVLLVACRSEAGEPVELSYGTSLPLERPAGRGGPALFRAPSGLLLEVPADALAPVPPSLVGVHTSALGFTGLAYLWGGCSGYGVDCSGFSHLVHRCAGIPVPRDAGDQSSAGSPVAASDALAGDLVFFARPGAEAHHVAFCSGDGRILHSPGTGQGVREEGLAGNGHHRELLPVGRRYAGCVT